MATTCPHGSGGSIKRLGFHNLVLGNHIKECVKGKIGGQEIKIQSISMARPLVFLNSLIPRIAERN